MANGRGAQAHLVGAAKLAARGAYASTLDGNKAQMDALVLAGTAPDGTTVDGTTSSGLPPADELMAPADAPAFLGVENTITAHAGGGQASAYQLSSALSRVTVVATAADSVRLKAMQPGEWCVVINSDSADSMQVFGAGTATINGVATGTGVALAAGKVGIYFCVTTGTIYGGALA